MKDGAEHSLELACRRKHSSGSWVIVCPRDVSGKENTNGGLVDMFDPIEKNFRFCSELQECIGYIIGEGDSHGQSRGLGTLTVILGQWTSSSM